MRSTVKRYVAVVAVLVPVLALVTGNQSSGQAAHDATLEVVGQVGGAPVDVVTSGDHAFLAVDRRVVSVDVSDPSAAAIVGQTAVLPGFVSHLAISGHTLSAIYGRVESFMSVGAAGLALIDIEEPSRPRLVSTMDLRGTPCDLAATSTHAYVAMGGYGLLIVDLALTDDPRIVGQLRPQRHEVAKEWAVMVAVVVSGPYAMVVEQATQDTLELLRVVDVSDPSDPREIGRRELPSTPYALAVTWPHVFVRCSRELRIVNVAEPHAPKTVSRMTNVMGARYNRIAAHGDYVYLVEPDLQIVDVSTPADPKVLSNVDTTGTPSSVASDGELAFVTNTDCCGSGMPQVHGLEVFDVSRVASPTLVAYIDRELWSALGVTVWDHLAIVAAGGSGLRIVDATDSASPRVIGQLNLGAQATDVRVSGGMAYVADGSPGPVLRVVDISDHARPRHVAAVDEITGEAIGVVMHDHLAIVALRSGEIAAIDVSEPTWPRMASVAKVPRRVTGIAASGNEVYVLVNGAAGVDTLYVMDARDASDLRVSASLGLGDVGGQTGLVVVDGFAYMSAGVAGVLVVDVRDPEDPVVAGDGFMMPNATGYGTIPGYVVTSGQVGLSLLSVSEPASPNEESFVAWPTIWLHQRASSVWGDGECAYAAQYAAGLLVACLDADASAPPSDTSVPVPTGAATPAATPVATSPTTERVLLPVALGNS